MPSTAGLVNEDTLITIKISFDDSIKRLKLPLKDLGANTLPIKLRNLLCIAPDQAVIFERYSDSAAGYVVLDESNPAVFKTLIRAAKAKLKLKLRASAPKVDAPASEPSIAPSSSAAADRTATALDQHSIGPGIFEFREALGSMKKTDIEAPLPRPFDFTSNSTAQGPKHVLPLRVAQSAHVTKGPWTIFCNACDKIMYNTHYHCGTCEGGDYDLCETCIEQGTTCLGEGHWLVKRSIQDGKLVSSTTERVAPKPKTSTASAPAPAPSPKPDTVKEVPEAFTNDIKTLSESSRTCNACVVTLPDHDFVTCVQCDDYDLCLSCHMLNTHGHHPAHHFKPAIDGAALSLAQEALLPAGRNFRHTAICDGCDKMIHGVRHKCFDCPDFDYCSECHKNARHTHPRHRFAAIYEQFKGRPTSSVTHHGIYCDGPLCKGNSQQSYIHGVRYKCVVCHDTDFCQNCEALPTAFHNKTHPLVKFKTPVNHLTISTESETQHGVRKLGDRDPSRNMNTPVMSSRRQSTNVTAPVKTVADIKPSPQPEEKVLDEKKVEEKTPISEPVVATLKPKTPTRLPEAVFVGDRVPDGTVIAPNARFVQSWVLRNPGPLSWPAGCSVRFVGGDNMLNIDNTRVAAGAEASESNVVGREVLPGEQFPFTVMMKAPAREGKCISYWRLKSADGTPFGHKLWCDIEVRQAPSMATETAAVPRSAASVQSSSQAQSYYALYKERMNALKTHLDQTNAVSAAASNAVSQEAQKSASEQTTEVTKTPAEVKVEVPESEHGEEELKGSQMVFPTLDKESPTSSTYQSFSGSGMSKKAHDKTEQASQTSEVADSVASDDEGFEDISDDLEVLSANEDEDETEDDGFLTDDDYDILDASDQETVASMK
ncbi:hypothetical protein M436DRAFT_38839 [Aureobasidium namibiae CBS 147.97]|uniref:ZZ-type domain-containing protein n=1 Tax=Aureobasidium namibiae CBS 147.97 TaxID=1043004 RepID=A0A074WTF5_9PEZI